jgi:hypothetical protein
MIERIDRRKILKGLTGGAVILATNQFSIREVLASCETDYPPNRGLLTVDWAPVHCNRNLGQDITISNSDMITHATLESLPIPDQAEAVLTTAYDLTWPFRAVGTKIREKFTENVPQIDPFERQLEEWQNHGEIVGSVIQKVQQYKGNPEFVPYLHPIQKFYDSIHFEDDELGNSVFYARLNTEEFIDDLYDFPESKIVNFAWQAGEVGIKSVRYRKDEDGNVYELFLPEIEILGAYREEAAYDNLSELTKICSAHDDKLFIVAAGNFGDRLDNARKVLEDEKTWPKNVLIIGEAIPGTVRITDFIELPMKGASGADIYVDSQNKLFNPEGVSGSTIATAITSGYAEYYRVTENLETPKEIKEKLLDHCRDVTHYGNNNTNMSLFNPD